jgi:hypothetical protein
MLMGRVLHGFISKDGCRFIYDDNVRPYAQSLGGVRTTSRASNVEPSETEPDCWVVDFSPLGGNKHRTNGQGEPFRSRTAALRYEVERLREFLAGAPEAIVAPAE